MNAKDVIMYGHSTFMRSLEAFPAEEYERKGACGSWSVKDILSHMTSFELLLNEVLESVSSSTLMVYVDNFITTRPTFNQEQVALRQQHSFSQILGEYTDAHTHVLNVSARLPQEVFRQVGLIPWYGPEYDLDDFIVYTSYAHKREHCAQIDAFSDRLKE